MGRKHVGAVAHQRLYRRFCGNFLHQRIAEPFAHNGRGIAFEITRMDDPACGRVDDQGGGFGNGMADRHELHPERPRRYHFGTRGHGDDGILGQARLFEFQPPDGGGKAARIDRLFQLGPQMRQRPDMVFMRMGDENRVQPRQVGQKPRDIGQDQIHAGAAVHIGKRHAQIDKDQAFAALWAIAVNIGVHADFTGPAQW